MQKYKSNITTTSGAAVRGVPVLVIDEDGNNAALFLDRAGTVPAQNPLTTGPDGVFYFYAVNGRYSLRTTVDGVTITDDDVVLMMDPAEITVAGPIAEAVAAAQAAATAAETAVANSGIPVLVSSAQNAVVDANAALAQAIASSNSAALSKTDADAARDTAVTAKMAAEAALDSFDDRYLGAKAVAPTVDNDGAALLIGALYWDTALPGMRSWNGSAWVTLQAATAAAISNTPAGGISSTTVQDAINELATEKANLASPAFTDTPTAPTAAPGTNTTQLATTEYARAAAITFGGIKAYATHAEAAIAASLLPDGADAEVSQDETRDGARTRYKVQAGALVFVVNLDQTKLDLAAYSGAGMVGYLPEGVGAVATTVQSKLREFVSVKDFGAVGDGVANDAPAINVAVVAACALGKVLHVPAGTYRLIPATVKTDEAGTNICAIEMLSNLHIRADKGAVFKIADNKSSNSAPINISMFFSNQVLSNITLDGLTIDMNGQNNPINHTNRTNAGVLFSGTPGGVAASGTDITIQNCKIRNVAGVTCIGMAQTNTAGATLGKRWKILNNVFENVGLDSGDHSSIFGWATDVEVRGNVFTNPAPFNSGAATGGLVACEVHGSNTVFTGNRIHNYYQGLWIGTNLTEDFVSNVNVFGNTAKVGVCFTDFYSANLPWGGELNERPIQMVNIYGNAIEIDASVVPDQVKVFFRIAARRQPKLVNIYGNVCRSYEVTKNTVLASVVVAPNQLAAAEYVSVHDNTAAGLNAGLAVFFGGSGASLNVASATFSDNNLGALLPSPGGLYPNADVVIYGPSAGKVESLRVAGLQSATPLSTDGHVAGRARVLGRAILPTQIAWKGLTLGNSVVTSKVSIDTDQEVAHVSTMLIVGSTAVLTGNIYPSWSGITASTNVAGSVSHVKGYAATALPSIIFATATSMSIYTLAGTPLDSSEVAIGSYLAAHASVPARYADV